MLLNEKELRRQTFLEQWNLLSLSLPSILVIIFIIIASCQNLRLAGPVTKKGHPQ